jgi:predicted RNA-binding Zn-ribbon protein involved in translation (DUF1610 family)
MPSDQNVCPVCGFTGLAEPAYDEHRSASFEICPCCGTEFGNDDATRSHADLRAAWLAGGARWYSRAVAPPPDWRAMDQLRAAGLSGAA